MKTISIIELENGKTQLLYTKINKTTTGIKKIVHRIVSDKELENFKTLNLNLIKEYINRSLYE